MQLDLITAAGPAVNLRGADFSPCGAYRYTLHRTWNEALPPVAFLMLNPSTADATANDPTVERCERRAREWGWGGLAGIELAALRVNASGTPAHPLYLSYKLWPHPYFGGVSAAYRASESLISRCDYGPRDYAKLIAGNKDT